MDAKQIVASYFFAQAAGTAAWWLLLVLYPSSIKWFQPADWPAGSLLSFWLADFVLLIGGSTIAGLMVLKRTAWAITVVWAVATTLWYPTLVCLATSFQTDEAWIASAMMVGMAGLTLAMATIHGNPAQTPATIRATPMSKTSAVAWTFAQTILFWGAFLWILPKGILELGQHLDWSTFTHPGQTIASLALFFIASILGLFSGATMAVQGDGTPLPTATAPKLVIAGPYRFVRNPMALAGIAQGIAIGWLLGSYAVIGYAITGAFVWHWFVRPVEEHDLTMRFGESYRQYQANVRLWIPTLPAGSPSESDNPAKPIRRMDESPDS